jgi:hypothetical protein
MTNDARLDAAIARVQRLNRIVRRLLVELADDPVRHMRRCKCGRHETRMEKCVACYGEELKRENRI